MIYINFIYMLYYSNEIRKKCYNYHKKQKKTRNNKLVLRARGRIVLAGNKLTKVFQNQPISIILSTVDHR